jgi:hypothetical protein
MVVYYLRFGTNYRSQIHNLALDGGTIVCPETWSRNCRSALRKIPKERRSRLHRGEGLKSRNFNILPFTFRTSKRPLSFTLHTPPISTLVSLPYYMARCTTLDSPQCVIFLTSCYLLLRRLKYFHQQPVFLPSVWETKFHCHLDDAVILYILVFTFLDCRREDLMVYWSTGDLIFIIWSSMAWFNVVFCKLHIQ